jgi:3'-phosphoadenosine 5'-phosphosulfate sulfotransferase (PAPS reductase)/FAD synthetase
VKKICDDAGVELVEVFKKCAATGKRIGLMEGWKRRMRIMQGREKPSPHWSSSLNRYCTSDYKIRPIDAYLRKFTDIISIEGIRWEESKKRAEKPRVQVRQSITTQKRKALTWYAIVDYTTEQVWNADGQTTLSLDVARNIFKAEGIVPTEWNFHPAYAMGNSRLSCAICVLANRSDVLNGVKHNPEVAEEMEQMEKESGFTFQSNFSITEAKRQLEQGVKITPKRTQTQFSLF